MVTVKETQVWRHFGLTNISTLLSVVLQFLVSNWTRDFFLESLTLIISLLFHVGQPKQAGGTALEGIDDTTAMPRWPFWFAMKPCSVWVGPSKSLGRHLEALQEHPRGSQTKPHANEFGETLLVAAYNVEAFRAAKCPQEFSARLHPRSSSLLQRVAADFGLK